MKTIKNEMNFCVGEKVLVKTPFKNEFVFGVVEMNNNKLCVVGENSDFVYEQSMWNNGTIQVKKVGE